ncbi:MAG TPA: MBL fold metallo-hydrolase [Hyphomicrobiales bacterium]|nr:MBL fold metallo-hydrolase [Hyphomicrobiales bacterium]
MQRAWTSFVELPDRVRLCWLWLPLCLLSLQGRTGTSAGNAPAWRRLLPAACVFLMLAGCSDATPEPPSTAAGVSEALLRTMGGREALEAVATLRFFGGGRRLHLGQMHAAGAAEPPGMLSELVETIDLANGSAAFDNWIELPDGFRQHRTEVYTHYQGQPMGWATGTGRPSVATSVNGLFSWATHNSPEFLLRRNPVSVALATLDASALGDMVIDGESYWSLTTVLGNETLHVYVDKDDYRLRGFGALDTETMWGDANTTYLYDDWRMVGAQALVLPFKLEIRKPDGVYANLAYTDIRVNQAADLAPLDVPAAAAEQAAQVAAAGGASWAPLQWNPVAPGVTHAVGFSHHSMVVEFPSFVAVVEAPYTEAQSETLARLVAQHIGKPIRYVLPTHPHYDHTGGVRALMAQGALVLTGKGHEAELRRLVEAPHTNPPDALARAIAQGAAVGRVEAFTASAEIGEGDQQLQLFEVRGIPHVEPMVLAYVPATHTLFQSDLFNGEVTIDAAALYLAIEKLGLEVDQIVGGHGGVLPYSALVAAIEGAEP